VTLPRATRPRRRNVTGGGDRKRGMRFQDRARAQAYWTELSSSG